MRGAELGPDAVLIAGPNGAGKTTFARQLLPARYPAAIFLNADEIQREGDGISDFEAGRILLARLDAAVDHQMAFAVETTLSSVGYLRRIAAWRARSYVISLHFIALPSADYAVERVRRRVASGGHGIPEVDIRRRFERGERLFDGNYKHAADIWYLWKSDDRGLRYVEGKKR